MKTRWLLFFLLLLFWTVPARAEFALGVASSNILIRSEADALRLSAYLEDRVGEPVTVRVLADEKGLHRWMNRFRQVDLGVFGMEYLLGQPAREFHRLAAVSGASGPGAMVMRQGSPLARVEAVKAILLSMAEEAEGAALLSSLGGLHFSPLPAESLPSPRTRVLKETAARKLVPAPSTRNKAVARKASPTPSPATRALPRSAPTRTPRPEAVTAPAGPRMTEKNVTLGVTAVNSLLSSEAEAKKLGSYLAARLDRPVLIRVFEGGNALFEELDLWRRIDLALLDAAYLSARPQGDFRSLAAVLADGTAGSEEIVAGGSLGRDLAERMRHILLGMDDDPEGSALLHELGKVRFVTPPAGIEGPALSVPSSLDRAEAPRPAEPSIAIPEEGIKAEMEGRWEDALFLYRSVMTRNPHRRDLWWRAADIQTLLGRPHDSAMSILWMLKSRPNDASLFHRLALAHLGNGQFKAALEACNRATILAPGKMEYLRTRAQVALWADEPETARESYLSILARDWPPSGR